MLSGFLFYGLTDDIKGFQNRLGLFFFILALFGFSTLTTLTVFASERLLFVRERANGYYSPITYFAAKVVFDIIPLRLIPPIILGSIVYPMVGLVPAWSEFFKFILILILFNLAAAAICLFLGILFKDGGVANLIGSLVMLFSLLFAGLLLNHGIQPPSHNPCPKLANAWNRCNTQGCPMAPIRELLTSTNAKHYLTADNNLSYQYSITASKR